MDGLLTTEFLNETLRSMFRVKDKTGKASVVKNDAKQNEISVEQQLQPVDE